MINEKELNVEKVDDPIVRAELRRLFSHPDYPSNYIDVVRDGWLKEIVRIINS